MTKPIISLSRLSVVNKIIFGLTLVFVCQLMTVSPTHAVYCSALGKNITCPNGDHPSGSTPNLGDVFTIDRNVLRAAIRCCGGSVNFDRLYVREESQRGFPGFHVHWDYDTNSSASCYTKNFDLHLYNDDCPGLGKVSSCPGSYLSGIDYFEYLCHDSCQLYESMTGTKCEDIVDQVSSSIEASDSNLGANNVEFALGDPDRRRLLQGAIDGLNELLPYAGVSHCGLSKVSSLNLNRINQQIDYLYDRSGGEPVCLEGELCWARQNTEYNKARREQARTMMEYTCTAYKHYQDSWRYRIEWKSTYSDTITKWSNKWSDGVSVTISPSCTSACWHCNDYTCYYDTNESDCIKDCSNHLEELKSSAIKSRDYYITELAKARETIKNYPSCISSTTNAETSACNAADAAYRAWNNCEGNCNNAYNAYRTAQSNCSKASYERRRCESAKESADYTINHYSDEPDKYQAKADAYQEAVNRSKDSRYYDSNYKYRIYYMTGNITGSYGDVRCANGYYYPGATFGNSNYKPYITGWYSYGYNRNSAISHCQSIVRSQGLNDCRRSIDDLPRYIQNYKYSHEWSETSGNNNYYCTYTNSSYCDSYTKNGGCHTNPQSYSVYFNGRYLTVNGLTKNNDGYPNTWSYNDTTMNVRCYKKGNLESRDDVEWMKSHISLPGFIQNYITPQVALINKRKTEYYNTIPAANGGGDRSNSWLNSWRKGLCSSWTSLNTRGCVAVNLLESCRQRANSIMRSSTSDVTHKSEGILTTYSDHHACTGDNDAVSSSRCYKFGCYVKRKDCRNVNQFFVNSGETCSAGPYAGSYAPLVPSSESEGLSCRDCARPTSCDSAQILGYRYDTLSNSRYTNIIHGYIIDDKNMIRYRTILGNCTASSIQDCKNIYYRGSYIGNCNVGNIGSALCEANGMTLFSNNNCRNRNDGRNTPVKKKIYQYDKNGNITNPNNPTECWTGECLDSCTANGYFTWADTNCYNSNSCLNGGHYYGVNDSRNSCDQKDTIGKHNLESAQKRFHGRTYPYACYNAHCRQTPDSRVPKQLDVCALHGYTAKKEAGWSCGSNEQSIGTQPIKYYALGTSGRPAAQTITCFIGCHLKPSLPDNSQQCASNIITNANTTNAGEMIYRNNKETRYIRMPTYLVNEGEQTWCYADKAGHNGCSVNAYKASHLYKIAAGAGAFAPASSKTVDVCRFDQCAPNDAAIVADGINQIYNSSACRGRTPEISTRPSSSFVRSVRYLYYIAEIGGLYDGCDGIYLYYRCVPQNSSCAPRCRNDSDLGYGTFQADCQPYDYYQAATWIRKDYCNDGSYSTTSDYHSTIACKPPTCPAGWHLSIDVNTTLKPDDTSGHTNKTICGQQYHLDCNHTAYLTSRGSDFRTKKGVCYGKGGAIQCASNPPAPSRYPYSGCHIGNTSCYKINGCDSEYDNNGNTPMVRDNNNNLVTWSRYPTEFQQPNEVGLTVCNHNSERKCGAQDDYIFIPAGRSDTREAELANYGPLNVNYKAGPNGLRCGRYIHVSPTRWTTSSNGSDRSNIYLKESTDTNSTGLLSSRCEGDILMLNKNSFNIDSDMQLNYNYFQKLIDISKLPTCVNISGWDTSTFTTQTQATDGYYICRFTNSGVTKSSELLDLGLLDASRNVIVFFDDDSANFHINTNIVVDQGHFKAFISKGKITIDGNVGKFPKAALNDNKGCSTATTADLQGFFGANEIVFDHTASKVAVKADLEPFNDVSQLYCDRQLVIAGGLAQWGKDSHGNNINLKLNRTFKGCVGGNASETGETDADWEYVIANPASYPDYNAFLSPIVLYQREDFNDALPKWMKSSRTERVETN